MALSVTKDIVQVDRLFVAVVEVITDDQNGAAVDIIDSSADFDPVDGKSYFTFAVHKVWASTTSSPDSVSGGPWTLRWDENSPQGFVRLDKGDSIEVDFRVGLERGIKNTKGAGTTGDLGVLFGIGQIGDTLCLIIQGELED